MGANLIGLGLKAFIQWGRESTWATAATINRRGGLTELDIATVVGKVDEPNMPAAAGAGSSQAWTSPEIWEVGERAEGTVGGVLDYEGHLQWFDMAFGTDTYGTYGASVTGVGPYTHVFTDREFLNSASAELIEGNIGDGKCFDVYGMKVRSLSLRGEAQLGERGMVRWAADVVAQKKISDQTPTGAISLPTRRPVLFGHATAITDGSGEAAGLVRIAGFEFNMRPAVAVPYYLGSNFMTEPMRNGRVDAQLVLRRMFTSKAIHDRFAAGTTAAPSLQFADGAGRSITLELARAKLVEPPRHRINADGFIEERAVWKATWSTFGAKVTVVNDTSGANA